MPSTTYGTTVFFLQEDRTRLSKPCTDTDPEFEETYGLPKTRFNCPFLLGHYLVPNCSIAIFAGSKSGFKPRIFL